MCKREIEGQIKMEFDKPFAGLELGTAQDLKDADDCLTEQLEIQTDLPQVPKQLFAWHGDYDTDSRKKRTKQNKKHEEKKPVIDISKIMIAQETKENSIKPIQPVRITGSNTNGSSVVSAVSHKVAKDMATKANELLKPGKYPYIKGAGLLTNAEKIFYKYMELSLNYDIKIMVKVRLADIVDINEAKTRDSRAFYKIACKHIDYVITDKEMNIICAVELDDYTHETPKAKERDQFVQEVMQECGIPFFRVGTRVRNLTRDDLKHIEYCILEYFAPTCPKCGRPMEPKESRNQFNYGHKFYGCLGFYEKGDKKCSYTIDID